MDSCSIARLPFIWVPTPFVVGDYRITPSCILSALIAFTLIVLLLFRRYFLHFVGMNLLFILRIVRRH